MKKLFIIFMSLLFVGCSKNNSEVFYLNYLNKEYYLGNVFSKSIFGEPLKYAELESCAFEGLDKTFTYEHIEVTTFPDFGLDRIYSIYLLDDSVTTNEGVKITDNISLMFEKYGNDYIVDGNLYKYELNDTSINFIVQNDIIISIEYHYNNI